MDIGTTRSWEEVEAQYRTLEMLEWLYGQAGLGVFPEDAACIKSMRFDGYPEEKIAAVVKIDETTYIYIPTGHEKIAMYLIGWMTAAGRYVVFTQENYDGLLKFACENWQRDNIELLALPDRITV